MTLTIAKVKYAADLLDEEAVGLLPKTARKLCGAARDLQISLEALAEKIEARNTTAPRPALYVIKGGSPESCDPSRPYF